MTAAPQRVLVTGAAGFVGRHLRPALAAAFPAARIIGTARAVDGPAGNGPMDGGPDRCFDLLDRPAIASLIAELQPDVCIHLAAVSAVSDSLADPDFTWRANVDGTRALADAILRDAPGCLLLHISSGEVYGLSFRDGRPLDEGAAMQPANPYAAAKAAIDTALGEMALRGLRVVRMRPLNHIGAGQSTRFAVAAFAAQIARIEAGLQPAVVRTGPLDRARDFLDVADVCAAYVAVLQRADTLAPGQAFNIGSGRLRRLADVLDDLLRIGGVTARIEADVVPPRPVDLPATPFSSATAQEQLGWRPQRPWDATLASIIADWRAQLRRHTAG